MALQGAKTLLSTKKQEINFLSGNARFQALSGDWKSGSKLSTHVI